MKSLKYMSLFALVAGLTACSQYEEPNPQVPVTPQEEVMQVGGLKVTPSVYIAPTEDGELSTIDLDAYTKLNFQIQVADVTIDYDEFPSNYDVVFKAFVADNSAFENASPIACNYANGVITVDPADLQYWYEHTFGRGSEAVNTWIRFAGYAQNDLVSNIRLNGSNYWYATDEFILSPVPPSFNVEEHYYLLGTINGWDIATAIELQHSSASVYDDPVFYLVVDLPGGEWWWKVIPESTYITGDWVSAQDAAYGVENNGDSALSGTLVPRTATEDCGAGAVTVSGTYMFSINMEALTYEFAEVYSFIGTPGGANGWNEANNAQLQTYDYVTYQGIVPLNGEFKFNANGTWATNWGKGAEPGTLAPDGANISAPTGLAPYYLTMSPTNLTYTEPVLVESIGLIGDFNSWGSQANLTPSSDYLTWTGTVNLTDGGFKFRVNDNWDIALGGTLDALTFEGGDTNIQWVGAGAYKVTLYLGTAPYHAEIVPAN